ncbi:transposase [Ligilactobacillus sp. WILCCON 0076]|uniref:Transposase n=1 Tax=Ligilactobacillus ubinensis TaxID=2876789 RepID=A0A9X2FL34_9LACO|nr:transposase [Ligilactobacillus ubinensis]MCP0887644.1 transposase [Ligilactobacillus ubinensis]
MTKHSTDFKIKSVQKYFEGNISISSLSKELKLPNSTILRGWIYTACQQGLEALRVKRHTNKYSLDFKAKVVEYYQTHNLGVVKVAAVFNISASQVYKGLIYATPWCLPLWLVLFLLL